MLLSAAVFAAPLVTLEGSAPGARYDSESKVRLSVLSWADQEQISQVVEAFKQYQSDQNQDAFLEALQQQPTHGYLFTAAATGYTIKYAWREEGEDLDHMVFLVTPGLKTRNPVLWKEKNTKGTPFTLVELNWQDGEAVMKTSLKDGIVAEDGLLKLESFESAPTFAKMVDDTPYYYDNQA